LTGKAANSEQAAHRIEMMIREHRPKRSAGSYTDRSAGYVYFVATADRAFIKIGWARRPKERLKDLQVSNHSELVMLGQRRGTPRDEKVLHKILSGSRARGEWFSATPEVLSVVGNIIAHESALEHLRAIGVLPPVAITLNEVTNLTTNAAIEGEKRKLVSV
jgi:hypothetical protein